MYLPGGEKTGNGFAIAKPCSVLSCRRVCVKKVTLLDIMTMSCRSHNYLFWLYDTAHDVLLYTCKLVKCHSQ